MFEDLLEEAHKERIEVISIPLKRKAKRSLL